MRRIEKILIRIFILWVVVVIIGLFLEIAQYHVSSGNSFKDRERIEKIINKKHPSFEIKDLEFFYVNFFHDRAVSGPGDPVMYSKVVIDNNGKQRILELKRTFFFWWVITSDIADYGSDIPDDVYFIKTRDERVGGNIDIDEYIRFYNLWVVTDNKGVYYTKEYSSSNSWKYWIKVYEKIYKTKDGNVYVFNKKISNWELSNEKYSTLCNSYGYTKVNKNYAIEIIEKNSSYTES